MFTEEMAVVSIARRIMIASLVLLVTINTHMVTNANDEISSSSKGGGSRSIPALNGDFNASDIFTNTITGESSEDSKGLLGTAMGHADINGDGMEDLYISAQALEAVSGETNSGICYVWYGSIDLELGDIDLDTDDPDLIIKGSKLDSKAVHILKTGDIDNDGNMDIVIGNPDQPESGKVFILWGTSSDWPQELTLPPVEGDEPNGYPVGFLRTNDYTVISGEVTTNVLGRQLGFDLEVIDLDGDSYEDVIFSFYGWNAVMIAWGRSDRTSFGNDLTYIKENSDTSKYGFQFEAGDLNDDGSLDLVVTAPNIDDEGRGLTRTGAIYVYYDAGRFKGNISISSRDERFLRPLIWGEGAYDNMGTRLILTDVNGDGKDDMLYGIPGDDGPQNKRMDAGQIQLILGDNITAFPLQFVSSAYSDLSIYGSKGKQGDYPGDRTGTSFAVGDMDADLEPEIIITHPGMEGMEGESGSGMLSLYETRDTFTIAGGVSDLSSVEPRMRIWGDDTEDNLGQGIVIFDINDDGKDDIFAAATSADGPQNRRSGCGEVYFLEGTSLSIGSMTISGSGTYEGNILSGAGTVEMEIPLRSWPQADIIEEIQINIDPEDVNIGITVDDETYQLNNDPYRTVEMDDQTGITINSNRATLKIVFQTTLFFRTSEEPDIFVNVTTTYGSVHRLYPDAFKNFRNIELDGEGSIEKNGEKTLTRNDWFTPGDDFKIEGIHAIYSDSPSIRYTGNEIQISLMEGMEKLATTLYQPYWELETTLDDQPDTSFGLSLFIRDGSIPAGYPMSDIPDLGATRRLDVRVDSDPPLPPTGTMTIPDETRNTPYDDDNVWSIEWNETIGSTLDPGGSGVKEFQVSVNGSDWEPAMEKGGLWVTYFRGREFEEAYSGDQGVEDDMEHTESEWGQFAPVTELYYRNYSIRYHGWFLPESSRDHIFGLTGSGAATLIIDGEIVLKSDEIATTPLSDPLYLDEGKMVPIVLLFQNSWREEGSWFALRLDDTKGSMSVMEKDQLLYPSNRTVVSVPEDGTFEMNVRSSDWAGLLSNSVSSSGTIDMIGPGFDLSSMASWYANEEPEIEFGVFDPELPSGPGSGIDMELIMYRLKPIDNIAWTNWTSVDSVTEITDGPDGPILVEAIAEIPLGENWRGSIQFMASDMVGNSETSSIMDIGVDLNPPVFEVLKPNLLVIQPEGDIELVVKVTDRPGAGVKASDVEFRYASAEDDDWSIWYSMNGTGASEEIACTINRFFPEGDFRIQFRAVDLLGNSGLSQEFDLKLQEKIEDQPPVPYISSPTDGAIIREGTPVILDAEGTEDDGLGRYDELVFSWFSNISGYLGSGDIRQVYLNQIGMHRITLYVDDGTPGHNISTSVNLTIEKVQTNTTDPTVNETEEDDPLLMVIVISIATVFILALVFVFLVLRYKKRKEEEIVLSYRERTEDDDIYEDRMLQEEREMGMVDSPRELSHEEMEQERKSLYGNSED